LSLVGTSRWSIRISDTVHADVDAVAGWWFQAEREEEYLAVLKTRKGVVDVSVTNSTEDGHRVRVILCKTAQGWEFEHRMTTVKRPERQVDRYILETHDLETARDVEHQTVRLFGWQSFTVECNRVLEVIAIGPQETRITDNHDHAMTGSNWLYRWKRHKTDMRNHNEILKAAVKACAVALGKAEGASSAP